MTDPAAGRLAALERVVALLGRLALPETPPVDAAFCGELRALLAGMGATPGQPNGTPARNRSLMAPETST